MALDTTIGGASSDSYGTLAAYTAYVIANIDAAFTGTDATHELNLRRAVQYIDRKYKFTGYKQYQTQALSWPRVTTLYVDGWPVNADTIPQDIINAQFEVAYAMEADSLDPMATVSTGATKSTTAKAGPVETSTEYFNGRETPRLVAAEGLLAPYIGHGGGQVRVLRG